MTGTNELTGPLLVVVPCSAAKLWHAAPAGELYTGSFYRLARSTADALVEQHGGQVVILSAKHGLLPLDQVVEPYEQVMGMPGSIGVDSLALQLVQLLTPMGADAQLVSLLPRAYRAALNQALQQLPAGARPRTFEPLAGAAGVGYQRQRLAQLRTSGALLLAGTAALAAGMTHSGAIGGHLVPAILGGGAGVS